MWNSPDLSAAPLHLSLELEGGGDVKLDDGWEEENI